MALRKGPLANPLTVSDQELYPLVGARCMMLNQDPSVTILLVEGAVLQQLFSSPAAEPTPLWRVRHDGTGRWNIDFKEVQSAIAAFQSHSNRPRHSPLFEFVSRQSTIVHHESRELLQLVFLRMIPTLSKTLQHSALQDDFADDTSAIVPKHNVC